MEKKPTADASVLAFVKDFALGQQLAFAAFVTALAQCVDKDKLEEQLRLQVTSYSGDFQDGYKARVRETRDELLTAAWKAVQRPLPRE